MANNLLRTRLNNAGYYETTTTPVFWRYKRRPIMFVLIVDDFGIEYVCDNHLHHLQTVLTNHYTITEDLDRMFSPGIELNRRPPQRNYLHQGRVHMQGPQRRY